MLENTASPEQHKYWVVLTLVPGFVSDHVAVDLV